MPSSPSPLSSLTWRCIGPFRGGRSVAVAADPNDPATYYFGSTGGGVWKTTDAGQGWLNVSDGFFKRASVGGLAVAPSDPNVIYAGMGETTIRGNVSHGDGIYVSVDAGKSWKHKGLAATRNIGKVRVDPRDPNTVFVAAFGHAHGPNPERGVYRSTDGGDTWDLVLHRNENAGACDLSIDSINPRVIYAAIWEARRGPYSLSSGGEGSGLFRSTDGGETWTELTSNPGLPEGLKGKIGIATSPARRDRVYAIVEAEEGGVFRSEDAGESWVKLTDDRRLRQRAWYYSHIIADPTDADTVWVLNVETFKSVDGGKTFDVVPVPHGDNHDLWIDPANPNRMILGNDGGATISFNAGRSWSEQYNQPTAELYHVTVDSRMPYRVYGSQQDNTSICVPSRSDHGVITRTEWYLVGGGEAGYIQTRPDNPNIVYAGEYQGFMSRYDHANGQARSISVWPEEYSGSGANAYKYRFQWTYPILLSPHNQNVLYCGGNLVFKSTDEGSSWTAISPDLTRNDPSTMASSGGPITKDNTGAEIYGTVFALAESPLKSGTLWAGSDDGLVYVTTNGGKKWSEVTPAGLPEWSLISIIEASPHDAKTAYLAANRYKHDDFKPYLFKTTDHGKHWTEITSGIPEDDFARVIREDPAQKGMLYAGTETGIYVSWNDGTSWHRLGGNLPVTPVHDLLVHVDDLVVGTHGRSFWILDDVGLVRQLGSGDPEPGGPELYAPKPTYRYGSMMSFGSTPVAGKNYWFAATQIPSFLHEKLPDGETKRRWLDAGENPPDGVIVSYLLPVEVATPVSLEFLSMDGDVIRTVTSKPARTPSTDENVFPQKEKADDDEETHCTAKAGLNRFVWDFRHDEATKIVTKGGDQPGRTGPKVPPGDYRVRLTVGEATTEQPIEIRQDPRQSSSQAELESQHQLLVRLHQAHDRLNKSVNQIRSLREQTISWARKAAETAGGEKVVSVGKALVDSLDAIEGDLLQVKIQSEQDSLNFPVKLNTKLAALAFTISAADAAPTTQSFELADELIAKVDTTLSNLTKVLADDVPAFNKAVSKAELGGISVPASIFTVAS